MSLRELEELIFDCVLYMEELKEHAEQITEDLLTLEPCPTPARSPSLSEAKEYLTDPQVPPNNATRHVYPSSLCLTGKNTHVQAACSRTNMMHSPKAKVMVHVFTAQLKFA